MSELTLTVAEIKELMDKMACTGLTALEITDGSFSLALRSFPPPSLPPPSCLPPPLPKSHPNRKETW